MPKTIHSVQSSNTFKENKLKSGLLAKINNQTNHRDNMQEATFLNKEYNLINLSTKENNFLVKVKNLDVPNLLKNNFPKTGRSKISLAQKYQFVRKLGKGSNSKVCLVKSRLTGGYSAVKIIQRSRLNTKNRLKNMEVYILTDRMKSRF